MVDSTATKKLLVSSEKLRCLLHDAQGAYVRGMLRSESSQGSQHPDSTSKGGCLKFPEGCGLQIKRSPLRLENSTCEMLRLQFEDIDKEADD